jgi:hypothetical protein
VPFCPRLGAAAGDLAAGLGRCRALAGVRELADERLMHDRLIRLDREDVVAQFGFSDFLAGLVIQWHLHGD